MKTIREIANELGVDKQKVYRFIKQNHINEAHHEAHQNRINEAVFDAVIEMLQKELEIKNEQIKELNERLSECSAALLAAQQTAQAAQALHAGTIQQQLTDGAADLEQEQPQADVVSGEKKGWFIRLFGR